MPRGTSQTKQSMNSAGAVERLEELIGEACHMVILTGAGISTESGVPDFRSPGGLWEQFRIVQYQEYLASEAARVEDWHRRFFMKDQVGSVAPNIGHKLIANWLKEERALCLITQNVDGLHTRAGTPSTKLIEIHGNATTASCISCGLGHDMDTCRTLFEATGKSPKCQSCDGILKADVVMFGQVMPKRATTDAFRYAAQADLFLAVGSSLGVHPAANLPLHAKEKGARVAIVNREATPLDPIADCVVHGEIGEVFSHLDRAG